MSFFVYLDMSMITTTVLNQRNRKWTLKSHFYVFFCISRHEYDNNKRIKSKKHKSACNFVHMTRACFIAITRNDKTAKRTCSWLVNKEDWLHKPFYLRRDPEKNNNIRSRHKYSIYTFSSRT